MTRRRTSRRGPNPPQLDSLSADTQLVTLTIGGNDIGFSDLAQDCVSVLPFGSPCRDRYTRGGDQISARIAATAPRWTRVLDGIHARSPLAKVLVVNYSAIFPHSGNGCWPRMPVTPRDVRWLRSKHEELNAMLATQASRQRRDDRRRLPRQRWAAAHAPGRARAGSSPTSRATPPPPCIPTCAGCRRWRRWWLQPLAPCDPDVVDAGLDEAGGRRVGGLDHDPDRLARERVERRRVPAPTRRCGSSPRRAAEDLRAVVPTDLHAQVVGAATSSSRARGTART